MRSFTLIVLLVAAAAAHALDLKPVKDLGKTLLQQMNQPEQQQYQASSIYDMDYRYTPVTMNILDQRFFQNRRQNELNDISDELERMQRELYNKQEALAPRQEPVLEPLLKDVVKSIERVNKRVTKQGDLPHAKENMATFEKLLDSVSRLNKRLDPKPATPTGAQRALRNKEIQRLLYIPQPQEETEEQQMLHERANSQSRMLHRMTHAIDRLALNTQADLDRKVKYDRVLNQLMHSHLNDPAMHDPLHDHLLAHHLTAPHSDSEFQEHLAQHMVYHDIGKNAEYDYLKSGRSGYGAGTAAANQREIQQALQQHEIDFRQKQVAAASKNHMLEVAENRENERHNTANTFAQNSYDQYKNLKPVL